MADTCPTVRIKCGNEQGFYIINEHDKTDEMVEYVDSEEVVAEKALSKKAQAKAEAEAQALKNAADEAPTKQPWQV
jgi:hypothetical protein